MKNILFLSAVFFSFLFLQSCNRSPVEPVSDRQELLTRTAWILVEGEEDGVIIKFDTDGTFRAFQEEEFGHWQFIDGQSKLLVSFEDESTKLEIISLTENSLQLREQKNGKTEVYKFIPYKGVINDGAEVRRLLTRVSWKIVSPEESAGMVARFSADGIVTVTGGEDGPETGVWNLTDNAKKIMFMDSKSGEVTVSEIVELSENSLKLRDTDGGNELVVFVPAQ